jgi:hypothetical protein
VVGFPLLAAGTFLFFWHLGNRSDTAAGWLVVIVTLLVSTTNNALGRKTPDLIFLVAFTIILSGFKSIAKEETEEPAAAAPEPWLRQTGLALVPRGPARMLRDRPSNQRARSGLSPVQTGRRRSG